MSSNVFGMVWNSPESFWEVDVGKSTSSMLIACLVDRDADCSPTRQRNYNCCAFTCGGARLAYTVISVTFRTGRPTLTKKSRRPDGIEWRLRWLLPVDLPKFSHLTRATRRRRHMDFCFMKQLLFAAAPFCVADRFLCLLLLTTPAYLISMKFYRYKRNRWRCDASRWAAWKSASVQCCLQWNMPIWLVFRRKATPLTSLHNRVLWTVQ